jgi:hypothetical protein
MSLEVRYRHSPGSYSFVLGCAAYFKHVRNTQIKNLNSVNQLIFVMVKCGVLFEVRTEFLNNI